MNNVMQTFEKKQIERLTSKKRIPAFRPGDTLKVTVRITEGSKSRLQAYEGICIARKNNSLNSNFTVRKISHGEGVERVFPLYSPMLESIKLIRKGKVRRSKLYYLRQRSGKSARIAEKKDLIKKTEQSLKQDNAEKKQANKSSKSDQASMQKAQEEPKQEVSKESKKESK